MLQLTDMEANKCHIRLFLDSLLKINIKEYPDNKNNEVDTVFDSIISFYNKNLEETIESSNLWLSYNMESLGGTYSFIKLGMNDLLYKYAKDGYVNIDSSNADKRYFEGLVDIHVDKNAIERKKMNYYDNAILHSENLFDSNLVGEAAIIFAEKLSIPYDEPNFKGTYFSKLDKLSSPDIEDKNIMIN